MVRGLRSVLLAAPATIVVAAAGYAADLPANRAAPVQYVRVCDAYGSGFFTIPGTDTCLRVGGYVRVSFEYSRPQNVVSVATGAVSQAAAAQDSTGLEVRGRIFTDARTQTPYGTVQTYVRIRSTNADGTRALGAPNNFATTYTPVGNKASSITLERAYIRFAGFTAGIQDENFNTAPGPDYFFLTNFASGFANGVKALKYTAVLPGGFTFENSIESRGDFAFDSGGGSSAGPSLTPTFSPGTYINRFDTGYNFVSTLTDTQTWGHVALSGAVGNNTTSTAPSTVYSPLLGVQRYFSYAIGPEIDILLPFIAKGDEFYANYAYSRGMLGEVTGTGQSGLTSDPSIKKFFGGVIREDSNLTPSQVSATGVPLSYGSNAGYEVEASYTHYWTPQWRSNFGANYARIMPSRAFANGTGAGLNTQLGTGSVYGLEANIIWSPVKAFDIGFDVEYGQERSRIQNPDAAFIAAGQPGLRESNVVAEFRVQRGF